MNTLQDLFTTVLNMSITASYTAIGVMLVRLFLKKAPKIFSYALWSAVLFRLICPVSFSSAFSFLNLLIPNAKRSAGSLEYVPRDMGLMQAPGIRSGLDGIHSAANASLPQAVPVASADPMQIWMAVLSIIWLAGILALLIYSVVSYVRIKRRLQTATLVKHNIYETDRIGTAFVCGLIKPKIYIPVGVGDNDLCYILEHELTHIRRRDYLIKPLAFLALILHWFNPLIWLSLALMSRDMEMSCDESVLRRMGNDAKCGYCGSLLSLSVKRTGLLSANPLAFGESLVKARIKNALNYKKPAFWVIVVSAMVVVAAAVSFAANPKEAFDIVSIGTGGGAQGLAPVGQTETGKSSLGIISGADGPTEITVRSGDIAKLIEQNLDVIMSSPKESSNPEDYINAHPDEFENIIKLGGEEGLSYMLSQFESGNADGLRAQIMMRLCKRLLGVRNNVTDDSLSPQEWYNALEIRQEVKLPNFVYDGDDPIEKLVYATETERNSQPKGGFTIVAPKIFGSYEEGDRLRVFVTTYSNTYRLYGNALDDVSGSVVPSAITYKNDGDGNYVLSDYEQAKDGSDFVTSIREFCKMPVSGGDIPGLADKILNHYGDYDDIRVLLRENLIKHLKVNGVKNATLFNSRGEIEFSVSFPEYTPEFKD